MQFHSWGGTQETVPALIESDLLLEKLRLQLLVSSNWSAKLPVHYIQSATLRSLEASEQAEQVFLHPAGYLEVVQNLVPLNRAIEKLGTSYLRSRTSYQITGYVIGNGAPVSSDTQRPLLGYFSRGQFEALSDDQKLSTADFDLMASGIQVVADQVYDISQDLDSVDNEFETVILDTAQHNLFTDSYNWQQDRLMNITAGRRAIQRSAAAELYGVWEDMPGELGRSYKVMSKETLQPLDELEGKYFSSQSGALEYLGTRLPEGAKNSWQVVEALAQESEEALI